MGKNSFVATMTAWTICLKREACLLGAARGLGFGVGGSSGTHWAGVMGSMAGNAIIGKSMKSIKFDASASSLAPYVGEHESKSSADSYAVSGVLCGLTETNICSVVGSGDAGKFLQGIVSCVCLGGGVGNAIVGRSWRASSVDAGGSLITTLRDLLFEQAISKSSTLTPSYAAVNKGLGFKSSERLFLIKII
jgi:hypothetical protein